MNFLPIRLKLVEDETAQALLRRAKTAVLESQTHQDCPFEKIVEAVKPERRPAQNPIYNVGFLLQNFPPIAFASSQVTGKFIPVETDSALLDLRFIADETGGGYSLTCEYRTALFERGTIESLLTSYCKILEAFVQNPNAKISELAISPELEVQSQKSRTPPDTIAVTATFTAEPLAEPLEFWMNELEFPARIEFAPYNQIFQQLLDPASLLASNARGLNVVLVRLEDWARNPNGGTSAADAEMKIERTLGDLLSALRSAAGRGLMNFLVCICPASNEFMRDSRRAEFIERLHRVMTDNLRSISNVDLIFPEQLAETYPTDEPHDPRGDELGHMPYTQGFFSALATMIARKFNSLKRPAPKVIALDCDQTLWGGVCGEDGADGITLDAARSALQDFMRAQLDAGRLLCLCSKNNLEDVQAVFARRQEMPLKLEHFAATKINWLPKSQNLKALAAELNLGLESFVLVDDNPVECAEVQANCPGAMTLQLPETPELIPQFLKHCWIFDHQNVTDEDRQRTGFYRQERQRTQARVEAPNLRDFLATLDLKIQIAELSPDDLPRAAQLTQRTNQFNCTTKRRSEAELRDWLKRGGGLNVSVSDRFGDYGLVGLVLFQFEKDVIAVETFLLSCRALGRGVEHRMLARVGELAKSRGAAYVDVHFVRSAKNKPALDFLESVGNQFRQALNGGYVFRFPTEFAAAIKFSPQYSAPDSPALIATNETKAQTSARSTFNRWRWIALEANEAGKIQALIEAKAGVRKNLHAESAAPKSEVEGELCRLWQELLRSERIGIRDNFFELGGHSLLAVRLFAQIEKRLRTKLPIVTIFQSPTVEQLARAIEQHTSQPSDSGLLPIQPEGARAPLFLVHGAGGDVLWGYANLAHHTNREQPIFGIQACGAEEFSTLEEMAAHYVEKVRAFQPTGPYHLGGYCFGGNVAQEMARQIEAAGESVALLALLDCAPSNCGYEKLNWRRPTLMFDFARNLSYWIEDFLRLKNGEQWSLIRRKLRTVPHKLWGRISGNRSREDFDLEEVIDLTHVSDREMRLWRNHLGLLVRHVSKPYGGHMTLFRTRGHPLFCSFENDFGWGKLAAGITIKNVPGSHDGIFMEPHVQTLAREVEDSLSKGHPIRHEVLA